MADAAESPDDVPPSTTEVDAPASTSTDNAGSDATGAVAETAEAMSSLAVAAAKNQESVPTPPTETATTTTVSPVGNIPVVPVVQPIAVEDGDDDDDDDEEEYVEEEDDDDDEDDEEGDEDYNPLNEFLAMLPPKVLPRITRLKTLNDTRESILEEYLAERAALELKYAAKMEPLYDERRKVVNGELDDAVAEKKDGEVAGEKEESEAAARREGEEDIKGIPQFWACAMGNIDVIAEMITEGKWGIKHRSEDDE